MARRHPLLVFFVLAYAITWAYEIGVLIILRDGDSGGLWIPPATFGPLIAAFITAFAAEGVAGVRDLLSRMARWRFGLIWYAIILIAVPLATFAITCLYEGRLPSSLPMPPAELASAYLSSFVVAGLLGGPLGEEPGWRGFALPRMQRHFGGLGAALVLGPIWAFWHLPLYFTDYGDERGGANPINFGIYLIGVVALCVIMSWVFNRTRGSVFAAMLCHASVNTSLGFSVMLASSLPHMTTIIAWGYGAIALAIIAFTRGKLGHELPGR